MGCVLAAPLLTIIGCAAVNAGAGEYEEVAVCAL